MSMMEKVKDFIGITDLEEDYEEEDLVSEGNPERNKMKGWMVTQRKAM